MPPYDPTVWVEDQTKLGPTNMNHIEQGIAAVEAGAQPVDADLTTIAGLSPTNDDFLQRKAGAWAARSPLQAKADLGLALNVYDYGVRFDDAVSAAAETAAWQAAFDALITTSPTAITDAQGMIVAIPPNGYGRSTINSTITVPAGRYWKLYAPGLTFIQDTDNTPHLTVTNADNLASSGGWVVEGPTWFTWTNQQATTVATQGVLSGTGTGTFTVTSSTPFPSGTITILIEKEQITGSFSGNTFTASARGANSTTAVSHANGSTVYPVGMTNACAVFLESNASHPFYANFTLEKVAMDNGSYLLGAASTANTNVWGYTVRDFYVHLNAVGGVVSNVGTQGGQPNNKIEDGYVLANEMVGPIFDFFGTQSTWMNGIEINNSFLSPIIVKQTGGGSISIGTLKSEIGTYDSRSGSNLGAMFLVPNTILEAKYIRLQGMNVDCADMSADDQQFIFRRQGGTTGTNIHIGTLDFNGDFLAAAGNMQDGVARNGWTVTNGNSFVTDSTTTTGLFIVDQLYALPAHNFYLTNGNNAGSIDGVIVGDAIRGRLSDDRGDADYTWNPLGRGAFSTLSLGSGSNAANGDTVTIGNSSGQSVTYTFATTPAAANEVKLGTGGTAWDTTLTNLAHAINNDGTPGTHYFAGTQFLSLAAATLTLNGDTTSTLTVTATPGTIGNTFVSTKVSSTLAWSGSTFSGGLMPANVVSYETTLTAARTVTLPTVSAATLSNNFNGMRVRIVRSAGGNFDLIIKRGTVEMDRIYSGQTGSIEYQYRRNAWVRTLHNVSVASSFSTPADPTGSTSATGVMMGLAGSITPVKSGKILVTICGDMYNNTNGDGAEVRLRYGTGSAPTNGAALTGTVIGNPVRCVCTDATERYPYSITALITGLTPGTAYWLDAALLRVTGGTASIENTTITAVGIT